MLVEFNFSKGLFMKIITKMRSSLFSLFAVLGLATTLAASEETALNGATATGGAHVIVFSDSKDKVLLLERADYPNIAMAPGKFIGKGELPAEAAVIGIKERTGLTIDSVTFVPVGAVSRTNVDVYGNNDTDHFFFTNQCTGTQLLKEEMKSPFTDSHWVSVVEILEKNPLNAPKVEVTVDGNTLEIDRFVALAIEKIITQRQGIETITLPDYDGRPGHLMQWTLY